jgi:two-component system chemotaxis response regulator CheB
VDRSALVVAWDADGARRAAVVAALGRSGPASAGLPPAVAVAEHDSLDAAVGFVVGAPVDAVWLGAIEAPLPDAVRALLRARPVPVVVGALPGGVPGASSGARAAVDALAAGAVGVVPLGAGAATDAERVTAALRDAMRARPVLLPPPLYAVPSAAPPGERRTAPARSGARAERVTVSLRAQRPGSDEPGDRAAAPRGGPTAPAPLPSSPASGGPASSATGAAPSPPSRHARPLVVVVLDSSGVAALERVVPPLPASAPAPVLVVADVPPALLAPLAERLDRLSPLRVREARDGDRAADGAALLVAASSGARLDADGRLRLGVPDARSAEAAGCADALLADAARLAGRAATAVLLPSASEAGAEGASAVRAAGGVVLALAAASSPHDALARAAARRGGVTEQLPIERLPGTVRARATALAGP